MTESGFRPTGTPDLAVAKSHNDFAMLEPREQLATLLKEHVVGRPFSELAAVTFDHRAATVMGHVLIDALEDAGYSIDDFDAVGALTAASVPMVSAMIQAAASRGEDLDGFVMDFVYPSIKGPSIEGRRVVLLDAWLSEKSYVQTSSLVTLRNGNELSLDFGIVEQLGAKVVAYRLAGRWRCQRHQCGQPLHRRRANAPLHPGLRRIRTAVNPPLTSLA